VKLFYVAVLALLLGGCASTNTKDQYPVSCEHFSKDNIYGKNTREDIEDIKVETSKKSEFYDLTPSKVFSGIESANLNKAYLTLAMVDNGLFEQYSAPVVDTMRQDQYEAHRFSGTFSPVGMFVWLLNPKLMNAYTFGCTARWLLSSEPDTTRKVKTGKSEWKAIQKNHRILVSGFDKDYEFEVNAYKYPVVIDLSTAISNTELPKNTTLKVTCLDCDLLRSEEQDLYNDANASVELGYDFRAVKALLVEPESKTKQAIPGLRKNRVKPVLVEPESKTVQTVPPPVNDPLNIRE